MPEAIFMQLAPQLARLHSHPSRCWLATQSTVCEAVCLHQNGVYYACPLTALPCDHRCQSSILLIESEQDESRLSWITELNKLEADDQATCGLRAKLSTLLEADTEVSPVLLQLTPAQGCFHQANNRPCAVSPDELARALSPAVG